MFKLALELSPQAMTLLGLLVTNAFALAIAWLKVREAADHKDGKEREALAVGTLATAGDVVFKVLTSSGRPIDLATARTDLTDAGKKGFDAAVIAVSSGAAPAEVYKAAVAAVADHPDHDTSDHPAILAIAASPKA